MKRWKLHVGLRVIKTALSVGLALLVARLLGSSFPIFAAIGAISAMSRNLNDTVQECLNQLIGTLIGFAVASVFVRILPEPSFFLWMGLGTLLVTVLCLRLKVQFAVPLACIVFADICLYGGGNDQVWYGFHRLVDTVVGLLVAFVVNWAVKPYNNEKRILGILHSILDTIPEYLRMRILQGRYPDLSPLRAELKRLSGEIRIYEGRFLPLFHAPGAQPAETAYLRGCAQLAARMEQELSALCCMDVLGVPNAENLAQMERIGLPAEKLSVRNDSERDNLVLNYHLENLLGARQYLLDLLAAGSGNSHT